MFENSDGLDPEKIKSSIHSEGRFKKMPDLYGSYREAFKGNFFIRFEGVPILVFIAPLLIYMYVMSGSVVAVIFNCLLIAIAYSLTCGLLSLFYRKSFMGRQRMSMFCVVVFALLIFWAMTNPYASLFV